MDFWNSLFSILLLVLTFAPLIWRFDAFNAGTSAVLATLCLLLPLFLSSPFAVCLAAGPLAIYLMSFGAINLRRRPFLVPGARDFAVLSAAVAGLVIVGPMELFFPMLASLRFGANVWILLLALYALFIICLMLFLRPRLVIYNIAMEELRPVLADLATRLDPDARWAGESLSLPTLGVQLHLDNVTNMRNVSLVASGPAQKPQGWRHLELSLRAALADVEVPRNAHAAGFLSAAIIILLFLVAAVSNDPQGIAQAMLDMFSF